LNLKCYKFYLVQKYIISKLSKEFDMFLLYGRLVTKILW